MPTKNLPSPRSLQEWMERHGINALELIAAVKAETGRSISPTMMSFILRGSRRCSLQNALVLHAVTGVPIKTLEQWPKIPKQVKFSGRRSKRAA